MAGIKLIEVFGNYCPECGAIFANNELVSGLIPLGHRIPGSHINKKDSCSYNLKLDLDKCYYVGLPERRVCAHLVAREV